ncbi:Tetrathionate reductase subunit B [bacterium HR10]|nr:Tetrathionate reductase subunit B [bacterium HR10]
MSEPTRRAMPRRRRFLKLVGVGAAGALLAEVTRDNRASRKTDAAGLARETELDQAQTENALLRMQQDLKRALAKPVAERSWVMVIDPRRCIGCQACVVSCKAENVTPPGVFYRTVPEIEFGTYPNLNRVFMPTNCMQCDNPPCMRAAPPGAITKRPDGIVAIDYTKFTSREAFEAARQACPYTALYFDDGDFYTSDTPGGTQPYETRRFYEYEGEYTRAGGQTPVGRARKCHFCLHRLNAGMLPACVTTCIGGAMYFGDRNDPQSLVSELLATHKVMQVKASAGTQPRVYYIEDELPNVRRLLSCRVCHR